MILRNATADDALDVLAWRNDPHTRAMSRTQDVVDEAAHLAWFGAALADPSRTLLIGEQDGAKVGMVRLDHGVETEVSININPLFRGRGLGFALLSAAVGQASGPLTAQIREENLASQRLFERCGFVHAGTDGDLMRYVRPEVSAPA